MGDGWWGWRELEAIMEGHAGETAEDRSGWCAQIPLPSLPSVNYIFSLRYYAEKHFKQLSVPLPCTSAIPLIFLALLVPTFTSFPSS